jgi:hypothetical protein
MENNFITIHPDIKTAERSPRNSLLVHLKELGKEEQTKP